MAFARGRREGFLVGQGGGSFQYEPIDAAAKGWPQTRLAKKNVMVACALVCAVALGYAATKGERLPWSQPSPPPSSSDQALGTLQNPASLKTAAAPMRGGEQQQQKQQQQVMPSLTTIARGPVQVRVANSYQLEANGTTDLSLYPWEHVAEPYRDTRLELMRVPASVEDGSNIM